MPDTSPRLSLPYMQAAQAQKHVTHNEALQLLDALVALRIKSFGAASPPTSPAAGDVHAVGSGATGAWAGQSSKLAISANGGWAFVAPQEGWLAWDLAEGSFALFQGGSWAAWAPDLQGVSGLGVNATWNSTNRLTVASDAVLLTHAGGGHQVKVNKAAPGETASLLFQSDYSGRAEMGLAGSDAFSIKVSPDGATWHSALALSGTGAASLLAGAEIDGEIAYHRGNVLGTVGLGGGVPTGGLLEQGTNANGAWLRFADGTQICWRSDLSAAAIATADGALYRSAAVAWTFPQPFAAAPAVTGGQVSAAGVWASASGVTTSGASALLHAAIAIATASDFTMSAIGRWA
ncbi:DUF2793 domain-containing protein [Pseudoroseicyclus sp. H15]